MSPRFPGVVLCSAAIVAFASDATAYQYRTTGDGEPMRWRIPVVEVVIDASLDLIDPAAPGAAEKAFATWDEVPGAELPGVVTVRGTADPLGYRCGVANHSSVRFAPDGIDLAGTTLAITVVTFGTDGSIIDADIVLSGCKPRRFVVGGEAGADQEPRPRRAEHVDARGRPLLRPA